MKPPHRERKFRMHIVGVNNCSRLDPEWGQSWGPTGTRQSLRVLQRGYRTAFSIDSDGVEKSFVAHCRREISPLDKDDGHNPNDAYDKDGKDDRDRDWVPDGDDDATPNDDDTNDTSLHDDDNADDDLHYNDEDNDCHRDEHSHHGDGDCHAHEDTQGCGDEHTNYKVYLDFVDVTPLDKVYTRTKKYARRIRKDCNLEKDISSPVPSVLSRQSVTCSKDAVYFLGTSWCVRKVRTSVRNPYKSGWRRVNLHLNQQEHDKETVCRMKTAIEECGVPSDTRACSQLHNDQSIPLDEVLKGLPTIPCNIQSNQPTDAANTDPSKEYLRQQIDGDTAEDYGEDKKGEAYVAPTKKIKKKKHRPKVRREMFVMARSMKTNTKSKAEGPMNGKKTKRRKQTAEDASGMSILPPTRVIRKRRSKKLREADNGNGSRDLNGTLASFSLSSVGKITYAQLVNYIKELNYEPLGCRQGKELILSNQLSIQHLPSFVFPLFLPPTPDISTMGLHHSPLVQSKIQNCTQLLLTQEPANNHLQMITYDQKREMVVSKLKKVRNKLRAQVQMDVENVRMWPLLVSGGIPKVFQDVEYWERERALMKKHVEHFIQIMQSVQGNRHFSPWKGSILDSVVGAFLTQNVSDHLSSSAFMAVVSRFPPKQEYSCTCSSETDNISSGMQSDVEDVHGNSLCLTQQKAFEKQGVDGFASFEDHGSVSNSEVNVHCIGASNTGESYPSTFFRDAIAEPSSAVHDNYEQDLHTVFRQSTDERILMRYQNVPNFQNGTDNASNFPSEPNEFPCEVYGNEKGALPALTKEMFSKQEGESDLASFQSVSHDKLDVICNYTSAPFPIKLGDIMNEDIAGTSIGPPAKELSGAPNEDQLCAIKPPGIEQEENTGILVGPLAEEPNRATGRDHRVQSDNLYRAAFRRDDGSCSYNDHRNVNHNCMELLDNNNNQPSCNMELVISTELNDESTANTSIIEARHFIDENDDCMLNLGWQISRQRTQVYNSNTVRRPLFKDKADEHKNFKALTLHHSNIKEKADGRKYDNEAHLAMISEHKQSNSESRIACNASVPPDLKVVGSKRPFSLSGIERAHLEEKQNGRKKNHNQDWESMRRQTLESCSSKDSTCKLHSREEFYQDSVDWEGVQRASVEELANTIKERGMNHVLSGRIKSFLNTLLEDHGSLDLEWLRKVSPENAKAYLMGIRGLGVKSVECIRLLTLHHIAFPVDVNVGRICVRLGWVPIEPLPEELQLHLLELYPVQETIQKYLWPRLCALDQKTLYELHYQLITFGKVFCTKRNPNCNACPMRKECKHFASAYASAKLLLTMPNDEQRKMICSSLQIQTLAYSSMENGEEICKEKTEDNLARCIQISEIDCDTQGKDQIFYVEEPSSPEETYEPEIADLEDFPYFYGSVNDFTDDLLKSVDILDPPCVSLDGHDSVCSVRHHKEDVGGLQRSLTTDFSSSCSEINANGTLPHKASTLCSSSPLSMDPLLGASYRSSTKEHTYSCNERGQVNVNETLWQRTSTFCSSCTSIDIAPSFDEKCPYSCNERGQANANDTISQRTSTFCSSHMSNDMSPLHKPSSNEVVTVEEASNALVSLPKGACIPAPKLKDVERLRTVHYVYELPDTHPLLVEVDTREKDDPSFYLLAIWSQGEASNPLSKLFCTHSDATANETVSGTLLIPCRTANRGRFPLNGTYFQVNEVFADYASSTQPLEVPRSLIWRLKRRFVYFGTSISSIFKGLTLDEIKNCFLQGHVCVRAFDRKDRAVRPLVYRLHFPISKQRIQRTNKEDADRRDQERKDTADTKD